MIKRFEIDPRRRLVAVSLALLLVLSGCSAAAGPVADDPVDEVLGKIQAAVREKERCLLLTDPPPRCIP